ncbi:hypothetical protein M5362_06940 [Streptomyces sp. Je 1-79]|uniref:hypothetical protein n=1 Tax=Streptomyces sp. Je 1-79 TaxID=2943847 RepID=UPI0021A6ED0C|nr:hypothetical protein [Streptomyces sp. Je 1-79]MCT4352863.1 hypothetical protein [Streptomyces sp. Je 1-79]
MRRGTALGAALLAGALALTGCGIRQSDVVEAGGPATIAVAPGEGSRLLLFYVDVDGRLTPAARALDTDQRLRGEAQPTYPRGLGVAALPALSALLRGPTAGERAAGLSTRLPELGWETGKRGPLVNVETDEDGEPVLRVSLDFPLGDLEGTAARQLVCTAAYAEETDGRIAVVLSGPGSTRPAERCDEFEVGTPAPTETPAEGGRPTTADGPLRTDPGTGGGAGGPGSTGTAGPKPSPTHTDTP